MGDKDSSGSDSAPSDDNLSEGIIRRFLPILKRKPRAKLKANVRESIDSSLIIIRKKPQIQLLLTGKATTTKTEPRRHAEIRKVQSTSLSPTRAPHAAQRHEIRVEIPQLHVPSQSPVVITAEAATQTERADFLRVQCHVQREFTRERVKLAIDRYVSTNRSVRTLSNKHIRVLQQETGDATFVVRKGTSLLHPTEVSVVRIDKTLANIDDVRDFDSAPLSISNAKSFSIGRRPANVRASSVLRPNKLSQGERSDGGTVELPYIKTGVARNLNNKRHRKTRSEMTRKIAAYNFTGGVVENENNAAAAIENAKRISCIQEE